MDTLYGTRDISFKLLPSGLLILLQLFIFFSSSAYNFYFLISWMYMMTDDWSLGFTAISGNEEICIGGQRLISIFSPVFLT